MKTRITALLLCFVVALGLMAGCSSEKPAAEPAAPASTAEPAPADTAEPAAPAGNYKVTLITMDQMDQHWVNVDKGCKEAVAELGNVDYNWLAPDVKDDAQADRVHQQRRRGRRAGHPARGQRPRRGHRFPERG